MKKLRYALAMMLVLALLAACGGGGGTKTTATPAPESGGDTATETTPAPAEEGGVIKIGLITPVTGTNKLVGEYTQNGAKLAQDAINASGGILGKQIEIVVGDEVDNMQDSVNATSMLLSQDDIAAIIGSLYSQYCIAVMPNVLDAKVPYFASGSSSGVSLENNPYTWQVRPIDTFQGVTLAEVAVNELGMTNPAILYSTQSTFASLAEQTQIALENMGIEISDSNLFGFPEEETNYAPYFAQVLAGDYDGMLVMSNQMPAALICQQAEIAGIDVNEFPSLGSTSFCSNVCITNAGDSANGWYSVADWAPGGSTEAGAAFEKLYSDTYGTASDLPAAVAYDSIYLIKEACEKMGATDRESINKGLEMIKMYPGAISTFSYFEDHVFATSLGITKNVDGKPTMISPASFREP